MSNKIMVGIIQASPVFSNLEASLTRAVALFEEAAKTGAQLVAFGETWLPGYPAYFDYCPEAALWNHEPTKEVFARLRQNSVVVPSRATEILADAARDNKVSIVKVGFLVSNCTFYQPEQDKSSEQCCYQLVMMTGRERECWRIYWKKAV